MFLNILRISVSDVLKTFLNIILVLGVHLLFSLGLASKKEIE